MSRKRFESLEQETLVWACMEPVHQHVRGKSNEVKAQVYEQLTPGQQALFMILVLHGHVQVSLDAFYSWLCLLLPQTTTWSAVKQGFLFFGDDAMGQLLDEIEVLLEARNRVGEAEWREAQTRDLAEDKELFAVLSRYEAAYHEMITATMKRVAEYVRNNAGEFVQFEESIAL